MAQGETVNLTERFSAFTADVVTYHFYGQHRDYLGSKKVEFPLRDALTVLLDFYNLTRFLPFPATTLKSLPLPLLNLVNPNFELVIAAQTDNKERIMKALNSASETKTRSRSVIVSALTDPSVPAAEKTIDRLLDEGETIIFAGIDTTARTLGVAMFHLLNDKTQLQKLRDERNALSKPADHAWTMVELEALPFMVTLLPSPYAWSR